MDTWIAADNTMTLWAFVMMAASLAIFCEHRFQWASKIPGAVIALIIGLAASNFRLIPTDAPAYDAVWSYVVPLAIPLLLFKTDLRKITKESSRLLMLFLCSSAASMAGAVLAFLLLRDSIPELAKITGMMAASYTGGGVNFAALTAKLEPTQSMTAAVIVADNLMMAVYFVILISLSASMAVRRFFGSPYADEAEQDAAVAEGQTMAQAYWQPKEISLKDIALCMGFAAFVVVVSFNLAAWLKGIIGDDLGGVAGFFAALFTDKWLLLPLVTFATMAAFRPTFERLRGSQEIGSYLIYLFFVVLGIPASIQLIITQAPLLFVFVLIIALFNLLLTMAAGKLFKFSIEEITLACNANIGGPTTAAALAISKGWRNLVGPIMVIGTLGYAVGNYIGTLVYNLINAL